MTTIPPLPDFGRRSHTVMTVVEAARHCYVRGCCVGGGVIASVLDPTRRSPDAMVTPPDIETQILNYYHAENWTAGTIARQLASSSPPNAFLPLRNLPGEQGHVDWEHFGTLQIGRARRPLMAFVMVLSHSRQIFPHFYLDARTETHAATSVHVHHSVVRRVLAQAGLPRSGPAQRPSPIDVYLPLIRETLEKFPTLTANRLAAIIGRILVLHSCPARCGARRRYRTCRLR